MLTVSVALFLFWGGPFWSAAPHASHVARFAVSYLAVLPLAAALLGLERRWSWGHLLTSTGGTWALKMIITALLYEGFASGTAIALRPKQHAPRDPTRSAVTGYRAAAAAFESGALAGRVAQEGTPPRGAWVFLEGPASGRALTAPRQVQLAIASNRYVEPVVVARKSDSLSLFNQDSALHTVTLSLSGRPAVSWPAPSTPEARAVSLPRPGLYAMRCAHHATERGWLLVVDHPYVAAVEADGRFRLEGVPVGAARVRALAVDGGTRLSGQVQTHVTKDDTTELTLTLAEEEQMTALIPETPTP